MDVCVVIPCILKTLSLRKHNEQLTCFWCSIGNQSTFLVLQYWIWTCSPIDCRWYFPPPLVWGYHKPSAMRIASHPFSKWDQMDQSIPRHVKSTSSRKSRHFQQYKGNYLPNHAKVRSFWVISPVPSAQSLIAPVAHFARHFRKIHIHRSSIHHTLPT